MLNLGILIVTNPPLVGTSEASGFSYRNAELVALLGMRRKGMITVRRSPDV